MVKTISETEYGELLIQRSFCHERNSYSHSRQEEREAVNKILQGLRSVNQSGNIDLIVNIERISLEDRLNTLNSSSSSDRERQEKSSLKAGIQRTEEAMQALKGVRKGPAYEARLLTTTRKDLDKDGLPKDSFRTFVTSQITSLNNQLGFPADKIEKNILEQRVENLRTAETLYKGLQRQALAEKGKKDPVQSMGDKLFDVLTTSMSGMSAANREKIERALTDEASSRNMTVSQYLEHRAGVKPKAHTVDKTPATAPKKPGDGERSR